MTDSELNFLSGQVFIFTWGSVRMVATTTVYDSAEWFTDIQCMYILGFPKNGIDRTSDSADRVVRWHSETFSRTVVTGTVSLFGSLLQRYDVAYLCASWAFGNLVEHTVKVWVVLANDRVY
jgi:hypothetical protein